MPIIKEEFKPQYYIDPITKKIDLSYQPKVTIFVKVQGDLYPFKILAFVDSGATRNLFPAELLTLLNIKLVNGRKKMHFGIGGAEVTSYTHEAEILIGGYIIETEIDFSEEHKPYILGIEKFFYFFDYINLNMKLNQTELGYSNKKLH